MRLYVYECVCVHSDLNLDAWDADVQQHDTDVQLQENVRATVTCNFFCKMLLTPTQWPVTRVGTIIETCL